jgi:hypothetical protein
VDPTSVTYQKQAVIVSTTNGQGPWSIRTIPDSRATAYSDPSVAVGAKGTVYFGYENGGVKPTDAGGHPLIAVSHDHGLTWSPSVDVGVPFGIQNTALPEVVAGDDNRAAFAFLGTPTGGNDQDSAFTGVWHLYVAMTYDGGSSWITTDATPTDPVQRGCIWILGGSNKCRNLLDFNDITADRVGRVLVGYADGCTAACVTNPAKNTYTSVGTIARQTCGRTLFARNDPGPGTCPAAATTTATAPTASTGTPGATKSALPLTATGAPGALLAAVAGLCLLLAMALTRNNKEGST